jgi:hypothetical protein
MANDEYFSQAGFSDAEWFCIIGHSLGRTTGLGQKLHGGTGEKLGDVIQRRCYVPNFYLACSYGMWEHSFKQAGVSARINDWIAKRKLAIEWYEREWISDNLARCAAMHPLIRQLQKMRTVIISNKHLRGLDFLGYDHFIEISSPNCHMEPNGIKNAVKAAKDYGKPAVYLVSAGVSAALIIDQLHDEIENSFFFDCGSIWDAFVGIGAQRGWRRDLYSDPAVLQAWKDINIKGPDAPNLEPVREWLARTGGDTGPNYNR